MGITHLFVSVTHKMTKLFPLGDPGSFCDTHEPGDPDNSLLRACFLTGVRSGLRHLFLYEPGSHYLSTAGPSLFISVEQAGLELVSILSQPLKR